MRLPAPRTVRTLLPFLAAGALVVCLGACRAHVRYDYSKEPDPRQREYIVGVSDLLSVEVWKNPDVSREVTVRPDGTITLPLLGDLKAEGRTPSELKDEITRALGKYLRGEGIVVAVAVRAVNSYNFTVSGNVERPGMFFSPRYVTVLEAIQLAGGPNRFASPGGTQLHRHSLSRPGKPHVVPIDYPRLLDGTRPESNLVLLPGDQIVVP